MARTQRPAVHDTKRCPECGSLGKIVDRTVGSWRARDTGRDKRRTRDRVYECYECETRWKYYV